MNIIIIPDLHGKDLWKQVDVQAFDKVVFLGDYVDAPDIDSHQIADNLRSIIFLKTRYPDKIVLLLGNHDMQYMYYPAFPCSGYDHKVGEQLKTLFQDNKSLFQYAWQHRNHIFTHAGISRDWLKEKSPTLKHYVKQDLTNTLGEAINKAGEDDPHLVATPGVARGGRAKHGGVTWADISETRDNIPGGLHQYVGHNRVADITTTGDASKSITYCDCLNAVTRFHEIEL